MLKFLVEGMSGLVPFFHKKMPTLSISISDKLCFHF